MTLPTWLRRALYATAAMNVAAAAGFLPGAAATRALLGFPPAESALYLCTVALFVFLFGVGYFLAARSERPERLFLAIAGCGKIGFVAIVAGSWLAGTVPLLALLVASPDLAFGCLFLTYVLGSPREGRER